MAISISIKKFKGREYVYIVDSYRDPVTKRPTSRTLVSFGSKEKLLAADPDAMSKVEQKLKELQSNSLAYSNTIEQRLRTGAVVSDAEFDRPPCLTCTPAVFHPIWEKLGMTSYFRNYRNNYKLPQQLQARLRSRQNRFLFLHQPSCQTCFEALLLAPSTQLHH